MKFSLLGFPVTIQGTVLVLGGIYLLFGLERQEPMPMVIGGILAIFGSILFHELGHALAARRFALEPIEITLHGFGGLTMHQRSDGPWKDLVIQLAGPAFGLALGGLSLLVWWNAPLQGLAASVVWDLVFINIFWSFFNLLPLYPLDGGQALSSVLRIFAPAIAWPVTLWLGLGGGVGLGLLALWLSSLGFGGAIFLLFVAGMIISNNWSLRKRWLEALREARPANGAA